MVIEVNVFTPITGFFNTVIHVNVSRQSIRKRIETYFFLIKTVIIPNKHGFMSGRSTTSNLMVLEQFLLDAFGEEAQVDVIYTDFSKAFDRVNIKMLIRKLAALGIHGSLLEWLDSR